MKRHTKYSHAKSILFLVIAFLALYAAAIKSTPMGALSAPTNRQTSSFTDIQRHIEELRDKLKTATETQKEKIKQEIKKLEEQLKNFRQAPKVQARS